MKRHSIVEDTLDLKNVEGKDAQNVLILPKVSIKWTIKEQIQLEDFLQKQISFNKF
jgi:hypothetical protein